MKWGILLQALVAFACALNGCRAFKVQITAGEQECLSATSTTDETQIAGKVRLSVDAGIRVLSAAGRQNYNSRRSVQLQVFAPDGTQIHNAFNIWQEATVSRPAFQLGTYKLCIKNSGRAKLDTFVDIDYFTVTHADTAVNDDLPDDPDSMTSREEPASQLHLTQVHDLVTRIGEQLSLIRGEQRFYRSRLARHLRTNEFIHKRTRVYWVIEGLVLVLITAAQLFTVHAMFRRHRPNKGILGNRNAF